MNSRDLRNFIEANKPLLDELESLAVRFTLETDNKEVCKKLQNVFEDLSSESGRFQLGTLDAVFEIYGQLFEQLANEDIRLMHDNRDMVSSGMEIIYKTLLMEDDTDIIENALTEVEDSLMTILSGESLELPPALLDDDFSSPTEDTPSSIVSNYLIETGETLEEINQILGSLSTDFPKNLEDIKILFHNINGNAKYMGFKKSSELSENVESLLLNAIGKLDSPDTDLEEILKNAVASLESLLEEIKAENKELTDVSPLLNSVIELSSKFKSVEAVEDDYDIPEEFAQTISEENLPAESPGTDGTDGNGEQQLEFEYLEDFFIEAVDHINDIESKLLHIEEIPDTESINSMLNSFHSIKGSSQYIGLVKIGTLSHKAENILDLIRKNEISVTPDIIEVLLNTIDSIRKLMKDVESTKKEGYNIEQVSTWLDDITDGKEVSLPGRRIETAGAGTSRPSDDADDFGMPDLDSDDDEPSEKSDIDLLISELEEHYTSAVLNFEKLKANPDDEEIQNKLLSTIHSIKGTSAYLPSPSVARIFENLEKLIKLCIDRKISITGEIESSIVDALSEFADIIKDEEKLRAELENESIIESIKATEAKILSTDEEEDIFDALPDISDFNDDERQEEEIYHIDESKDLETPDFKEEADFPDVDQDALSAKSFDDSILEIKGFGKTFLKNMKAAGFDSREKINSATLDSLLEVKGMNLSKAQKIMDIFNVSEEVKPTVEAPLIPSMDISGAPSIPEPPTPVAQPPAPKAEEKVKEEPAVFTHEPAKPEQPVTEGTHDSGIFEQIIDDDYDRELISIYLETANEYLTNSTKAIAAIDDSRSLKTDAVMILKTNLSNLLSSSNYMEYDKLCAKIHSLLERIESYVQAEDVNGFLEDITREIEKLSKMLPSTDGLHTDKKELPEAVSANLDTSAGEDEELISIFVRAADKNIDEIRNVLTMIKEDDVDAETMSNLHSNLNNLQLSANFLGFENLFDIIDDAKSVSNQLHDDDDRVDLSKLDRLEDYLQQITKEVSSIKRGVVVEIDDSPTESPAPKVKLPEPAKTASPEPAPVAEKTPVKIEEKHFEEPEPEKPVITEEEESKPLYDFSSEIEELAPKTLRVDIDRINDLLNMASEMVINRAVFTKLSQDYSRFYDYLVESKKLTRSDLQVLRNLVGSLDQNVTVLGRSTTILQDGVMKIRLVPINLLFRKIPRIVRDLSRKTGKKVRIEFKGEETELDRTVIEKISDPLIHIMRNAVDHGIESPEVRKKNGKSAIGTITCSSYYEGDMVIIDIHDDGVGIDIEKLKAKVIQSKILSEEELEKLSDSDLLEIIFFPGFSTSDEVTTTSGRGVGMDVVKDNINKLGGTVTVNSEKSKGTTVTLRIPLTLAIIKTLLVKIDTFSYAVPVAAITETVKIDVSTIKFVEDKEVINFRDQVIPLLRLSNIFSFPETIHIKPEELEILQSAEDENVIFDASEQALLGDKSSLAENEMFVIVLHVGDKLIGLHVDSLVGEQDIVIENLDDPLVRSQGISGAAILGDGTITLILDVNELSKLSVEKEKMKSRLARQAIIEQIVQETRAPEGNE